MEPEVAAAPCQVPDTRFMEYVPPGPESSVSPKLEVVYPVLDTQKAKKEPEPVDLTPKDDPLYKPDCKAGALYKPVNSELEQTPTISRSGYKFTHGSFMPNNPSSLSPQMGCDNPEKKKEETPACDPDTPCKACGNPLGTHNPEFGFGQWSMGCIHCGAMYHICKSGKIKYGPYGAKDCPDCMKIDADSGPQDPSDKDPKDKKPKDPEDKDPKDSCSDTTPKEKEKPKDAEDVCPICAKPLSKPINWELGADGLHLYRKSPAESIGKCCVHCMMIAVNKSVYLLV